MKSPSDNNANAILLLDDEFDIMTTFTLGLEQQGFHVVGFTEPLLALDDFKINSEQYRLVISYFQDAGNEWISIHPKSQGSKTASKSILYIRLLKSMILNLEENYRSSRWMNLFTNLFR